MLQKYKARTALLCGILLISIYPVFVKWLGELSVVSAFYRMFVCAVCLLPIVLIKRRALPKGKVLWGTMACGVCFGLDVYCWNLAIEGSSATQATLLTNLAPVFVGILAFLFLPQKPRINFWIGSAIAIAGMVVFIGWRVFADLSFDIPFLLGLASAMLYAIYITLSKWVLEKAEILPYMLVNNLTAAVVLGIINYNDNQPFVGFSNVEWAILIAGGLFCQLLAWYLISYATKYMRATRVSLSLLSQTVLASILASLLLKEVINLQAIIGGIIILIGIGITFLEKPVTCSIEES